MIATSTIVDYCSQLCRSYILRNGLVVSLTQQTGQIGLGSGKQFLVPWRRLSPTIWPLTHNYHTDEGGNGRIIMFRARTPPA